jgi:uncharacterized protein DUF1918
MSANVGDRIAVESEKAGRPPRLGEILEVTDTPWGVRYRVRWDDGHDTVIRPTAGSMHVIQPGRSGG